MTYAVRSRDGVVARFQTKREASAFVRTAASPTNWLAQVGTTTVTEGGVIFRTDRPVTFRFVHNNEPAPKIVGDPFKQSVEPAGFFCLHVAGDATPPRGWTSGMMHFNRPLVLARDYDGNIYGPTGWKTRLSIASGGKKKKALSSWLLRQGYDGVVTVSGGETSEIVALHPQASIR